MQVIEIVKALMPDLVGALRQRLRLGIGLADHDEKIHAEFCRCVARVVHAGCNFAVEEPHSLSCRDRITVHGSLVGLTVAYVGDYNNVSRSLGEACVMLGATLALACPVGYHADDAELERVNSLGPGAVTQTHRPAEAVVGAVAVHTDSWTSMGQEAEKQERSRAFEGYSVDDALMSQAAPGAAFYHCLPAYRGLEVSFKVIDGPASRVFAQAHNRMHVARGALAFLLGVR